MLSLWGAGNRQVCTKSFFTWTFDPVLITRLEERHGIIFMGARREQWESMARFVLPAHRRETGMMGLLYAAAPATNAGV